MIREKRQVQKVNKKEVQPLIYSLFSYFEGEINYTLAGYVCKVLCMLLTKKPTAVSFFLILDAQVRPRGETQSLPFEAHRIEIGG